MPPLARPIQTISRSFDVSMNMPGSKSIALRQLSISALCRRPTVLVGLPECDDVDAMVDSLQRLNVSIERSGDTTRIDGGLLDLDQNVDLDIRMSGVSLRILLALAALRRGNTSFVGHASLAARPNEHLLQALTELGVGVEAKDGKLPIEIKPTGRLRHAVTLDTSISSQYLTALLVIAPRLVEGLVIELRGERVSEPYTEITSDEMRRRGVHVKKSANRIQIDSQNYSAGTFDIQGDASASTYFMALATLHNSKVTIRNVGTQTQQGDFAFAGVCEQLGATVERTATSVTLHGPPKLRDLPEVDMSTMLDAAPTFMAIAPYLQKSTKIVGIRTLRYRECDRISCPARELRKAGIVVEEGEDHMVIHPSARKPANFDTYDDHRMAMSLAVFASKTSGCSINDPDCVRKTYTRFWDDLDRLYQS